ncbi:MAG: EamA family transporter [Candidatus Woesearchaeota archaeon]|jgi:uncharacterized membrane protein|nr:EamA family transporter [Candidatus Woesearchaeota archaeon]
MVLWIAYALISALTISIKDILVKKVFKNKNTSPYQIIFEEYFLLLLIVLILFSPKVDFSSYILHWHYYLIKSVTLVLATIIYFKLLQKYEVSSIVPLMNLSPMFLLILSIIFLGELINLVQFFGVILIIISTYILEINFHNHKKKDPNKHHFDFLKKLNLKVISSVLIMLIVISMTAIADKKILNEVNVYTNMYFTGLLIFVMLSIYYLSQGHLKLAFKDILTEPSTLVISIFAIISTFFILLAIGTPGALVSLIIPLKRTSTLFASIGGGILFHEKHMKRKLFATIGMLCGVLLIVF